MTVFTVPIKDAVKVDISIVKLFNDKKVVLIDPVGISGL